MKKLLYGLFFTLIVGGCTETQIGYLEIEHAKYSINNIEILTFNSLKKFILEKQKLHDDFIENNRELMDLLSEKQSELDKCDEIRRSLSDQYYVALFAYYDYLELIYPIEEDEKSIELLKESNRLEKIMNDYIESTMTPLEDEIEKINNDILINAEELGTTPELMQREINKKQNILDKNIPWTSTTIEGILGTNPIRYEIVEIKSDEGDVHDLRKYLEVGGGGRIILSSKVNSPKGKYVVSLSVSNEGQRFILNDIYTIILL